MRNTNYIFGQIVYICTMERVLHCSKIFCTFRDLTTKSSLYSAWQSMALETPQSCSFHNFIAEALFSSAPALCSFRAKGANLCRTFYSYRFCRIKIIKILPIQVLNIIWNLSLFISFLFRLHLFTHTHTHTPLDRTPLDEWSARSRHLYLPTHNTYNRQISMPPDGIRTRSPSKREAPDPLLRPHRHRDQLIWYVFVLN